MGAGAFSGHKVRKLVQAPVLCTVPHKIPHPLEDRFSRLDHSAARKESIGPEKRRHIWRDLLVCSRYMAFFESVSFRIATVLGAEEPSFENRSGGVVSCVAYGKKCSTSVVRGTVTAKLGPRLKSAMFALLVRRDGTKEISSRQDGSQRAARDCSSRWATRCFRSRPAPLV